MALGCFLIALLSAAARFFSANFSGIVGIVVLLTETMLMYVQSGPVMCSWRIMYYEKKSSTLLRKLALQGGSRLILLLC